MTQRFHRIYEATDHEAAMEAVHEFLAADRRFEVDSANAAGDFRIVCNEFCGIGHHLMVGKVVVE